MYSVYLKKGEEKRILNGHSWVYANEVAKIEGKDKNGSLASVFTHDGRFIGKGYINHLSKILVRIFIRDENQVDDKAFYLERLKNADDFRKNLGYDNCYRMVFAEADDIPALIVDKYDEYLSVQFLTMRRLLLTEKPYLWIMISWKIRRFVSTGGILKKMHILTIMVWFICG